MKVKTRLLIGLLCLILMVSMVVPGCGSAPASTPAAPAAVSTSAAPAAAPTTAAPAAASTSAAPAAAPTTAAPAAAAPAASGKPLKIGVLLPYTGFDPRNAPQMEAATRIAVADVGSAVAGRPIELFFEDEATDPKVGVEKARKLVESNQCEVLLGALFGNVVVAVAGYAQQAGVAYAPFVQQSMSAITTAPNNVVLPTGTLKASTYPSGAYAADVKKFKTASILYSDYIAGEEYIGGFEQGFKDKGGQVVQRQAVPLGTNDFAPYLTNLKQTDVVAFWFAGTMGPFMQQYYDFGVKAPLVATTPFGVEMDTLAKLGDKALGVFGSGHETDKVPDTAANKKFVAAIKAKINQDVNHYMYSSYVGTATLLEAIKATGGDTKPEKLVPAWRKVKVETPMGVISFNDKGVAIGDLYVQEFAKDGGTYYWNSVKAYPQAVMAVPGE